MANKKEKDESAGWRDTRFRNNAEWEEEADGKKKQVEVVGGNEPVYCLSRATILTLCLSLQARACACSFRRTLKQTRPCSAC